MQSLQMIFQMKISFARSQGTLSILTINERIICIYIRENQFIRFINDVLSSCAFTPISFHGFGESKKFRDGIIVAPSYNVMDGIAILITHCTH
jgi:hypothetical protein